MTGKILADVVESFLAALLLDKGLTFAKRFLEVSLFPKLAVSLCFPPSLHGPPFPSIPPSSPLSQGLVKSEELLDPNTRLHQAAVYTCKREATALDLPEYRCVALRSFLASCAKPPHVAAVEKKIVLFSQLQYGQILSRTVNYIRSCLLFPYYISLRSE